MTTEPEEAGGTDRTSDRLEPTFDHPDVVAVDEPFGLEIGNLPSNGRVEVTANTEDAGRATWSGSATFEVADGSIDLDSDVPVAGDYAVADTMELIQFMTLDSGQDYLYVTPERAELTVEVAVDGDVLGSTAVTRTLGNPDVTDATLNHDAPLPGYLAEPPGDGPAPGVVALHGSGGRPLRRWAEMFASHGFVALAPRYFGGSGLPEELVEVPVELVDDAAKLLLDHERVGSSRVALFGASTGAELALLAGSHFDSVGAVVGIAATGVAWPGVSRTDPFSPGPRWTVGGEPVPYVPYEDDPDVWDPTPPRELEPGYTASLEAADEETIREAEIPVEGIAGPVLLVSGGDDALWDSARLSSIAMERLDEHEHPHRYDHLVFEDAGHYITYPYVPATHRAESFGYVAGGTPAGYARADAEHWPRALETLGAVADD